MAALSPEQQARARKTHSTILHALASAGQKPVADALGKSEATISRLKSEDLETFAAFLTAIGMKVVPLDAHCYPAAHYNALRTLALEALARQSDGASLKFEDDE